MHTQPHAIVHARDTSTTDPSSLPISPAWSPESTTGPAQPVYPPLTRGQLAVQWRWKRPRGPREKCGGRPAAEEVDLGSPTLGVRGPRSRYRELYMYRAFALGNARARTLVARKAADCERGRAAGARRFSSSTAAAAAAPPAMALPASSTPDMSGCARANVVVNRHAVRSCPHHRRTPPPFPKRTSPLVLDGRPRPTTEH